MNTIWLVAICTFWCNFLESTVTTWPVDFNPTLRIDLSVWTHIYNANTINILGTASPCSRGYWLSACVTRPEHPKGARNVVKQARRAKRVAEGHQLEIGAQRAPRFLVRYNTYFRTDSTKVGFNDGVVSVFPFHCSYLRPFVFCGVELQDLEQMRRKIISNNTSSLLFVPSHPPVTTTFPFKRAALRIVNGLGKLFLYNSEHWTNTKSSF